MSDEQNVAENTIVPGDEYLKSGIHIGTKFKTKYMAKFIYKTRPDSLSVLDIAQIDERLKLAGKMLSEYNPQDILIACRRENGWHPAKKFGEVTGIKVFAGRYPPGIMTNTELKNFIEAKILLVADVWPDRNAVKDAMKLGIPVISLSDTNNTPNNVDLIVPCNNKGKKSLALIFYILAKEYLVNKGMINKGQVPPFTLEDFQQD